MTSTRQVDARMLEARRVAHDVEFARRARIISSAEAEGLIDYLTCPACQALVPIPADASWPDCPRCGRCV